MWPGLTWLGLNVALLPFLEHVDCTGPWSSMHSAPGAWDSLLTLAVC